MRQIITLAFIFAMVNCAIGQTTYVDLIKGQKPAPSTVDGSKEISGEIVALDFYKPGVTDTIYFAISLESPDFESGDLVELTFPAGITPVDGSPEVGHPTFPLILNDIVGQTISWGEDNNSLGGVLPNNTYEFWVEVEVDAGLTGEHVLDYYVSGHEAGAEPHFIEGTLTLLQFPTSPDLFPKAYDYAAQYFKIPLEQASFTPMAKVTNQGPELTTATDANLTIGTGYDESVALTIPMGTDVEEIVTFPEISFTETGTVTFTYFAEADDDYDTENSTVVKDIEIHETHLARHSEEIAGFMSLGDDFTGIMATVIYVTTEDVLSGISFNVQEASCEYATAHVYEFNGMPGEIIATSFPVTIDEPMGVYTATFPTEITLEPGYYLLGIEEPLEGLVTLAHTADEYVDGGSWVYGLGAWNETTLYGMLHTYWIDGVFGEWIPSTLDVALEELTIPAYVAQGDVEVSGIIKNESSENITSVDVEYSVEGGTAISETFDGLNIVPLESFEFTFEEVVSLTELGTYDFTVTITDVNGEGPDYNPDNDELMTTVNVIEYVPTKRVVGEEATGTWCGWCVRGHVFMEYMEEHYDDSWIGIAVHNMDPMVVPEYDFFMGMQIPGYPSGLIDRVDVFDPADFEVPYLERIEQVAPAEMMIENIVLTGETLSFDVSAEFIGEFSNLRFNAVIVEDYVTGTEPGYNQANYYAGGPIEMGGYELLPDPVPAADMVYQDVARALLGTWDGVEGSLPETVYAGETHSYSFSVDIEDEWDIENLEIVGMLINQNTGMIENAVDEHDIITGISTLSEENAVSVYPNPATNEIRVATEEVANVYVYNINGQLMMEKDNTSGVCTLDISGLSKGTYIVKVISNTQTSTTKVNVMR